MKLWNKFRVSNIPSLIFIDANTGKGWSSLGALGRSARWWPAPFSEIAGLPLKAASWKAPMSGFTSLRTG
ncbi:hypothetical protein Chor_005828 [Crotalus horridus]